MRTNIGIHIMWCPLSTCIFFIAVASSLSYDGIAAVQSASNRDDATTSIINATLGRRASLPCHVDVKVDTGDRVTWHSPSGELLSINRVSNNPRFKFDARYPSEFTLINDEIREDEGGVYECRVTVNQTPYALKKVQLVVNMPPRLIHKSNDIEVASSDDVTMTCTFSGIPKPIVTWTLIRHNESPRVLPPSGEIKKMTSVKRHDAGLYICTADNGIQPFAEDQIRVNISFKPHLVIPYKEVHQLPGSGAMLECIAMANPKEDLYWSRDGTRLENTVGQYRIRESASVGEDTVVLSLEVLDLDLSSFNVYTCYAKNNMGSAFASVSLVEFNGTGPVSDEVAQCQVSGSQASMSVVAGLATALGLTIIAIIVTLYWFFVVKKFHHQDTRHPVQPTISQTHPKNSNNHFEHGMYIKRIPDELVVPAYGNITNTKINPEATELPDDEKITNAKTKSDTMILSDSSYRENCIN